MDFQAIMRAASQNQTQTSKSKNSDGVLKTKLAAPKKNKKKKVDVQAIKKIIEQQNEPKQNRQVKPEVKSTNGCAMFQQKKHIKKVNKRLKDSKHVQPKQIKAPTKPEVLKYDSKEQEDKHKRFMAKVHKIGESVDSSNKQNDSNTSKFTKIAPKKPHKPMVQPPNFSELMALAEKMKEPNAVKEVTEPKTKAQNSTKSSQDSNTLSKLKHQSTVKSVPTSSASQVKHEKSRKRPPAADDKSKLEKHENGEPRNKKKVLPDSGVGQLSAASKAKLLMKSQHASANSSNTVSKPSKHKEIEKSKPLATSKQHAEKPSGSKTLSSSKTKESKPADRSQTPSEWNSNSGVSAWDRLMGSASKKDKPVKKKQKYIDSDEEDDNDSFIDDDEEGFDYSRHIRDIFGYDKSRYHDEDFDDRSMVANFADVMKEEARSARLALKEDLNDIKMEEEHKKMKMLKKLKKK